MKYIDNDGNDYYLILWATQPGRYGHLAIGVDNYKYDEKINKQVPDGTMCVYGLFPNIDYNQFDAVVDRRVQGIFVVDKRTTIGKVKCNSFNSGEYYNPDGLLQVSSDFEKDSAIKEEINGEIKSNKGYRGNSRNCSTFVRDVINKTMNLGIKGEETFLYKKYVTPNRLFKEMQTVPNVKQILFPAKLVNNKVLFMSK